MPVMKRELSKHLANACLERLVSCKFNCGLRIVAHRMPRHEAEWCEAPELVRLRGLALKVLPSY